MTDASDATSEPVAHAASVAAERRHRRPTPTPTPTASRRCVARAGRWLVVGIVAAALAVGGVIAAFALRPTDGGGGGGSDDGGSASTAELAVPLDTDWVDTGLYCYLGDEFVIEVTGRGWLDDTPESQIGPDGLTDGERPEDRVLAEANTGSVIGRLDTTPEIFSVGQGTTYACPAQGNLELGINDTDLDDNSGEFGASVTLNQ